MRNPKMILPMLAAGALVLGSAGLSRPAYAKKVKIKLGTLAPKGSAWFNRLSAAAARVKKETNGKVKIKIYPGGVLGDESDMVRKMRIGQLHAAMITGVGLGSIDRSFYALQTPMMIQSYEELDYVRDRIGPKIAGELEKKGFKVLGWGDVGWIHFFSKSPDKTVSDYQKRKLFVWSGDPGAVDAWKAAGFDPVPLSTTDVMASLQSGLINTFGTSPLYALSNQWFGLAKHMVKVNWSPMNGAIVIGEKKWKKIPAEHHDAILRIFAEEGRKMQLEVRKLGDKAIKAMTDRGLSVHQPSAAEVAKWRAAAEAAHPTLRGKVIPAQYFDGVKNLVAEYRKSKK